MRPLARARVPSPKAIMRVQALRPTRPKHRIPIRPVGLELAREQGGLHLLLAALDDVRRVGVAGRRLPPQPPAQLPASNRSLEDVHALRDVVDQILVAVGVEVTCLKELPKGSAGSDPPGTGRRGCRSTHDAASGGRELQRRCAQSGVLRPRAAAREVVQEDDRLANAAAPTRCALQAAAQVRLLDVLSPFQRKRQRQRERITVGTRLSEVRHCRRLPGRDREMHAWPVIRSTATPASRSSVMTTTPHLGAVSSLRRRAILRVVVVPV